VKAAPDRILRTAQADYLERTLPKRSGVLSAIERQARADGVPIVDPEVGLFLDQVVRACGVRRALEVGTAIGYSGVWIASALPPDGQLVTIDVDPERIATAKRHFGEAGIAARVECLLGPGLEVLPRVEGPFDLVFLDALKEEYRGYVELALPKLRVGGGLVCDNLLWGGQVAEEVRREDERASTLALRKFNPWFVSHPQLRAQILPLGDGTGFAVKVASP
jgi:predicted O-methyltransferase YrrM